MPVLIVPEMVTVKLMVVVLAMHLMVVEKAR